MPDADGRMLDAVEHGGLDHRIMYHVLEYDSFANLQSMVEAPAAHVVATQATVAPQTIDVLFRSRRLDCIGFQRLGPAHGGLVRHFQAIGHVTGETHIENGRADASTFHDIDYGRHQGTGLPGKGGTGFQNNLQVRITALETLQQSDEVVGIVVLAGHQVTTTQVEPLDLGEPATEFFLDVLQGAFQFIRAGFAMTVTMEAVDTGRQLQGQQVGRHPETGTGSTGIVKLDFHLGIFGIDANTAGNGVAMSRYHRIETFKLAERVEGDVAAAVHQLRELGLGIGRRIGMRLATELFEGQTGFVKRTGRCVTDVLAEDGERLPHGEGFEGENDLDTGTFGYMLDQTQILAKQGFLHDVARRGYLLDIHHRVYVVLNEYYRKSGSTDHLETGELQQQLFLTGMLEADGRLAVVAGAFQTDDFALTEPFVLDAMTDL